MSEMAAFVKEFVSEGRENLDQVERGVLGLERHPTDKETLATIFRAVHNLKGGAGLLGFAKLAALAHAGETLLSRLRDRELGIGPEIASGLLGMVDRVRHVLGAIEASGDEGHPDHATLIARLSVLAEGPTGASSLLSGGVAPATEPLSAGPPDPPAESQEPVRTSHPTGSIRVGVEQLDRLMDLVGELVLTRNEMLQVSIDAPALMRTSQRLNLITTQLQQATMKARMQAVDHVWSSFPRLVRDLALECGKSVRLEVAGHDTELDRTVLEAIKEPLTHLLRNCIDHGIEHPLARAAVGKPTEGRISLRAWHEGGQVTIELFDDGAGIDIAAVARKAVERGLITSDHARLMSESDTVSLIFLPGFSTADQVTKLSGRGVGMDVVKSYVESIGGRVTVQSEAGFGTTVRIRIPLTLAIMPGLIVAAGGARFVVPQIDVVELLRLEAAETERVIEVIHNVAVYRLRGELCPLVWLHEELTLVRPTLSRRLNRTAANIVVLQTGGQRYGIVVDEVEDIQEIVVKPLGEHLRDIPTFAGATILGDGAVALILDVMGLAVHAGLTTPSRETTSHNREVCQPEPVDERRALLLVAGAGDSQIAIPLSQVMRLEEFPQRSIERVGDVNVVQYLGEPLLLVSLPGLLAGARWAASTVSAARHDDTVSTIVCAPGGRRVGLVVDGVLDTIAWHTTSASCVAGKGAIGSVIARGRVTQIVDLDEVCAALNADLLEDVGARRGAAA